MNPYKKVYLGLLACFLVLDVIYIAALLAGHSYSTLFLIISLFAAVLIVLFFRNTEGSDIHRVCGLVSALLIFLAVMIVNVKNSENLLLQFISLPSLISVNYFLGKEVDSSVFFITISFGLLINLIVAFLFGSYITLLWEKTTGYFQENGKKKNSH